MREHLLVRGIAGLGFLDRGELELLEQHLAELLGRIDVELHAGLPVDLVEEPVKLAFQLLRQSGQDAGVHPEPGRLHLAQHHGEGKLHPLEQLIHARSRELLGQDGLQAGDRRSRPGGPRRGLAGIGLLEEIPLLRLLVGRSVVQRLGEILLGKRLQGWTPAVGVQ